MQYAVDNGMLNLAYVQERIEMTKRDELLKKHPYKIWEGTDGKWHTYLPDGKKGRIPRKRNTLEEIQQVVIDYWKQQEENPTIQEVFNEWNDRRLSLKKIKPATHMRNKQIFNRFYKKMGKKRIKSLEVDELEDFLEEQIAQFDLTAKAFSNLKSITKGFLKRAKKRKLTNIEVSSFFTELDVSDRDFKKVIKMDYEEVFSEDELPILMSYLKENLDIHNACILLLCVTGIRIGEAVALKKSAFEANTFKIVATETRYSIEKGKYTYQVDDFPKTNAGVRTVIIPNDYVWLIKEINRMNPFGEFMFMKNGERIRAMSVRMRLKRICKRLNIYPKSPHKIRKTYCSILLDNNVDQKLIIQQVGHTDISCTEDHYHRNRKSIEQKAQILNSIPDFKSS